MVFELARYGGTQTDLWFSTNLLFSVLVLLMWNLILVDVAVVVLITPYASFSQKLGLNKQSITTSSLNTVIHIMTEDMVEQVM